jgi:hypothetical protein
LIPKGNSGNYHSIGRLEVIWKLIERVLDERILEIKVHDCLHGFRAKHGCGTGIMEAKLAQQLAFIKQSPRFGIFIDLWMAYDVMNRERCIDSCHHEVVELLWTITLVYLLLPGGLVTLSLLTHPVFPLDLDAFPELSSLLLSAGQLALGKVQASPFIIF